MTNQIFKKNESVIRIQAERSDPLRTNVVFFSHDKGTAKMLFRLEKDGAPQPLSSGTEVLIHLTLLGAEAKKHIYYANIDDPAAGLVSIILKDDTLQHQGRVEGSIYIKPPNDQHLDSSGRFLFNIERSPIDDISEDASQFYYEGFTLIYEQIAEVRKIVSTMTTEARAAVDQKIRDLETQINQFFDNAQSKFTSLDSDIAAVRQTVTQLENRLTTVRNEIEALFNTLNIGTRNYILRSNEFVSRTQGVAVGTVQPDGELKIEVESNGMQPFSLGQTLEIGVTAVREHVHANFKQGDDITLSLFFKGEATQSLPQAHLGTNMDYRSPVNGTQPMSLDGYTRYDYVFKYDVSGGVFNPHIRFNNQRGTYILGMMAVYKTNRGADWVPAIEDFAYKDDLAVGARNYLVNSENPSASSWTSVFGSTAVCRQVPTFNNGITRVSKVNGSTEEVYYRFMNTGDGNLSSTLLEEGKMYTLSLDVRAGLVGSDRIAFRGQYRLASGNWISLENWAALDFSQKVNSNDFSRVSHSFLIPKGAQSLYFSIQLYNNAGTIPSDGSWMEFKKAHLGQGKIVVDGGPAPEEMALKNDLDETQQKVQTLEENTIRLTNQFPDPRFQNRTPQPVAENGVQVAYDSDGIMFNHFGQTQGRVYWASPPLGLEVGKSYNVSMRMNSGTGSVGKEYIVGTSNGDNFSFIPVDASAYWVHGTIRLTNWSAFSIWMPPVSYLRIRELYIYEANTDITTARIERLEKDNSLPAIVPTFAAGFANYAASGDNFCQAVRHGDMVTIRGAIAPTSVVSSGNTLNNFLMGTLPVGYGPKHIERQLAQGSGRGLYHLEITTDRRILCSRYRGHNTGYTQDDIPVGSWLVTSITYVGEDI